MVCVIFITCNRPWKEIVVKKDRMEYLEYRICQTVPFFCSPKIMCTFFGMANQFLFNKIIHTVCATQTMEKMQVMTKTLILHK